MQEINEELENDRSVLEWMLGQYVRAKRRKKQLEVRLLEINAERDSPIGGQGYDPLPRSGGNNEGAAGILMKLADIEDRIYEQKAKADKSNDPEFFTGGIYGARDLRAPPHRWS